MMLPRTIAMLTISLVCGCGRQSDSENQAAPIFEDSGVASNGDSVTADEDSEVAEFERKVQELKAMPRGGDCYESIGDDKNRALRNRHLSLRLSARNRLVRGIASDTPITDHWHLMCRWYMVMLDESERLKFDTAIFNTEDEIRFAERQVAMGMLIGRYSDDDVVKVFEMIAPYLGRRIRSVGEIKKEYGVHVRDAVIDNPVNPPILQHSDM